MKRDSKGEYLVLPTYEDALSSPAYITMSSPTSPTTPPPVASRKFWKDGFSIVATIAYFAGFVYGAFYSIAKEIFWLCATFGFVLLNMLYLAVGSTILYDTLRYIKESWHSTGYELHMPITAAFHWPITRRVFDNQATT